MAKTNILVLTKTSSEDVRLRRTYSSWSRRLQDVFWRWRQKTSSRLLQEVFIKTNVCWAWSRRIYSPYSYVFRRRLQEVFRKTNIFALVIPLQDAFKALSRRLQDVFKASSRHLQDVFKTSSRRLQDVLKTSSRRLKHIFKMSSRRLQDVLKTSSRHLQDVSKTYYQVKVFLVTQFVDVFETYSKRFWDVLLRRLSARSLPRSYFRSLYGHYMVTVQNSQEW